MNYCMLGRKRLGLYLPKTTDVKNLVCPDEELKAQLVLLLSTINTKIIEGDWTASDYIKFRGKIAKMEVNDFEKVFPELICFLHLRKKELETKLRELDQKADTHIFDDQRITEIIIDEETKEKHQEQKIVSHTFSTVDLAQFFAALLSRINQYNNILLQTYNSKADGDTTITKNIEDLLLLIEMLDKNDSNTVNIIKSEYNKWANAVITDAIIGNLIERMLTSIIQNNKRSLNQECEKLDRQKNIGYLHHVVDAKNRHRDFVAQRSLEHYWQNSR